MEEEPSKIQGEHKNKLLEEKTNKIKKKQEMFFQARERRVSENRTMQETEKIKCLKKKEKLLFKGKKDE